MTALTYTLTDSTTMLRRNLRHQVRYLSVTIMLVAMPIVFLLLFVYVFGGTLGAGLGAPTGGRTEYVQYLLPGILLMAIASVTNATSISVAQDMTEGIVARFRTMAISRVAVLSGHVLGATIQTMLSLVVVMAVAVAIGFRTTTGPIEWLAAGAVLALIAFAINWLAVAMGAVAKSVETASNTPILFVFLPFLSSGFVPVESLPTAVRWFAEYQPFTPFIETVRGLLVGTPIGNNGWLTLGWCGLIGVAGYLWARSAYDRQSVRS